MQNNPQRCAIAGRMTPFAGVGLAIDSEKETNKSSGVLPGVSVGIPFLMLQEKKPMRDLTQQLE